MASFFIVGEPLTLVRFMPTMVAMMFPAVVSVRFVMLF
jgi:hypothetical protein